MIISLHAQPLAEGSCWRRFEHAASAKPICWESLWERGLLLVLNLNGQKRWQRGEGEGTTLAPRSVAVTRVDGKARIEGLVAQRHEAVCFWASPSWLHTCLGGTLKAVVPQWQTLEESDGEVVLTTPLEQEEMELAQKLGRLPEGALQKVWLEAQWRCLLCSIFQRAPAAPDDEFFCLRYHKICDDRVERAHAWLRSHLDSELDLKQLAAHVGCSQFYLSRIFSERTGQTIRQCHRRFRLEEAARLLKGGRFNVSEVAVEVGYRSLSHFTKAFTNQMGCRPSEFSRNR